MAAGGRRHRQDIGKQHR
ncbi:unnamed protein product [Cuscuta epithymum]|uniref:Uncharacterized protein n=1 Tax=Cuscuta epithymum TaxID=186058 RepID=A0AAV0CC75_9ASTE|nr:unnamed protein product [Cuscuta epithymum]